VLDIHHVFCTEAQAAVGEAVERAKPGKVSVRLQMRELCNAPFLGFVRGLARKRKVADLCRRDAGLELVFDDAQQEGRFA
jgi:hypothetical protein